MKNQRITYSCPWVNKQKELETYKLTLHIRYGKKEAFNRGRRTATQIRGCEKKKKSEYTKSRKGQGRYDQPFTEKASIKDKACD